MGQVCLQGHLQLRDQFTGAVLGPHTLENLKVFPALDSFSIPDKISTFGLVGHAVVSLPSPPPPSTCQCSHPARRPSHGSCPVCSPVARDLPQTCVLPRRGSTPRDLEPWPGSGEAAQILLSRGFSQILMGFIKILLLHHCNQVAAERLEKGEVTCPQKIAF